MAMMCENSLSIKLTYPGLIEHLARYKDDILRRYNRDLQKIKDLPAGQEHGDTRLAMHAEFAEANLFNLSLLENVEIAVLQARSAAAHFLLDYASNLTRLDGSRNGPVGLLDNAFAIADCLAAGRMNNAQVLRDQAVQLLDQRAYEDQASYAEDLERQKDPENYVYVIPQRLFVFVHELMGQRAGQEKQPWGKWDIIGDKEYIAAARAVYTEDMDKAAQVLCNLCNLHVQYSNPFPTGDNDDRLMGVEFDNPVRSLWPTEIFAWLRLRHERGLALPQVEHPLLDQPLGRFDPSATPKPDYEPWFTQLVGKLVEFNPRYADLPQLVFDDP